MLAHADERSPGQGWAGSRPNSRRMRAMPSTRRSTLSGSTSPRPSMVEVDDVWSRRPGRGDGRVERQNSVGNGPKGQRDLWREAGETKFRTHNAIESHTPHVRSDEPKGVRLVRDCVDRGVDLTPPRTWDDTQRVPENRA